MAQAEREQLHLRAGGVSVVVQCSSGRLPEIVYWGADLGEVSPDDLAALAALKEPLLENTTDVPVRLGVLPEHGAGWMGTPGVSGHRRGKDWSPLFSQVDCALSGTRLSVHAEDPLTRLDLDYELELLGSGLLRARAVITNRDAEDYDLQSLAVVLPLPAGADEILDLAGRWAKERVPQRHEVTVGTYQRDVRRGRTGADSPIVLTAGVPGFGFRGGELWGVHVAWSGNHRSFVERMASGRTVIGGGELLLPGEVILGEGDAYATPWLYAAYGQGLDDQASRFHRWLRTRERHPSSPRPVTLNVWEAVYFDHRLEPLLALAERAARVGVERFVLDDGWFTGRRDDSSGLGDWFVDADVWPDGLHPLVDRVRALGMQFGLWFEPEMVSPDSDLARQHPEWILQVTGRLPLEARRQQVLDLTVPEAFGYILHRISTLVDDYGLGYLKWDHNRDLIDAGSAITGQPLVHDQTAAVYALLDELRVRHPQLEIESCSSGGARVDLGILERTDRVWASDCIDPLERQQILRWTSQLLPGELVGSHIGSSVSHTTGRTSSLDFRAVTAMFGHFGIEWDINGLDDSALAALAAWVRTHKRFRPLLHSGTMVRGDTALDEVAVTGIVSQDATEALFSLSLLARPSTWPPGLVHLPGLDPLVRYAVGQVGGPSSFSDPSTTPSWQSGSCVASGRILGAAGIQVPLLQPEQSVLVHVKAVS
jgi:alpha-galactosidase